jgi:hypothetical protein
MLGCHALDLHLLLREAPFAQLFRAHDDLRSLAPEARVARLEEAAARREEPPRCDDAVLERDLALIRRHGQGRRSLPPDILDDVEADPNATPAKKAHLRRLCMAMPQGP